MIRISTKSATRLVLGAMILVLAFGTLSFAQGYRYQSADAWKFGVHGDTQWTLSSSTNPQHTNRQYVNGEIINLLNQHFAAHGVKFVLQVGDLSDRSGDKAMKERADRAASLYNMGIGFFPLRGNHETYGRLYGYDLNFDLNVPAFRSNFPQTQGLPYLNADGTATDLLFGATNISGPAIDDLKGLSYSFDYGYAGNSARFVVIDVEQTKWKETAAPNNPDSCVEAIRPGTPAGTTPFCGQGYLYYLSNLGNYDTGQIVYQATHDITNGVTVDYDSAGNAIVVGLDGAGNPITDVSKTIVAGEWFRIDSDNRPSTHFYAWDMPNPDQLYEGEPFDINDPPALPANRKISVKSTSNTEYWPGQQQPWISERLDKNTRGTEHAFVFSHRPLMGVNHVDGLFGANPNVTPEDQNAFFASLYENDVKFLISGHDHIYNRALVVSPDGESQIEQLISIGASSKFYSPASLDGFGGAKNRETQISQETHNIGYYLYTVDGSRVTVDYYSDADGNIGDTYCYPRGVEGEDHPYRDCGQKPGTVETIDEVAYDKGPLVPGTFALKAGDLNFVKKETWGYSLNGKQFLIGQGESYTAVKDSFGETTARIIAGTNKSISTDLTPDTPRTLYKTVNTGWIGNPVPDKLKSDILSLWGMSELGAFGQTDTYVLAMSFNPQKGVHLGNKGGIGTIVSLNQEIDGEWVNAVDLNFGGTKRFVSGPYHPKYGLGTYGFDPSTRSAWAVLNYNADFSVANDIITVPPGKAK